MPSVRDHYDRHLAGIYAWMLGGAEAAISRAEAELASYGVAPGSGPVLDLGAGFGTHAIPLARLGYDVTAVDGSQELLDRLGELGGGLPIRRVRDDSIGATARSADGLSLGLCMGDTLTHLASVADVNALLEELTSKLAVGGKAIVTLRDYTAYEPGARPLFCVRGDDTRIASCMLEIGESTVRVHDLLHERVEGTWTLRASSYLKLRLDPTSVEAVLSSRCEVETLEGPSGLVALVATRR